DAENLAFLPDGRILLVQKHGRVLVYKNGAVLPTPFIDLSDRVNDYWDHGLLGIAVDPSFATNGYVYLLYTYENDPSQYAGTKTARLARYTAVGDTASPSTERVLLGTVVGSSCQNFPPGTDCIPSDEPSHSIGTLKFASDGTLFVSTGDAASSAFVDPLALRSMDLTSLAGKMLRIDPTGQGLPTNPFWTGNASDNRSKVWAYGVRNTYRFHLRPGSDVPYGGDAEWSSWDEVNVFSRGANLGWPCYEGNYIQPGYQPLATCQALYAQGPGAVKAPLVATDHQGGGMAHTGGPFYTGTAFPAQYQGAYFFGDYANGWIRTLRVDSNDNLVSGPTDFATGAD